MLQPGFQPPRPPPGMLAPGNPEARGSLGQRGWEPGGAGLVLRSPRSPSLLLGCDGAEAAPAGHRLLGDSWAGVRQLRSRTAGGGGDGTPCLGEAPHSTRGKGDKEPGDKGEKSGGGGLPGFLLPPARSRGCSDGFIQELEARTGTWGLTRDLGERDVQVRRCKLSRES